MAYLQTTAPAVCIKRVTSSDARQRWYGYATYPPPPRREKNGKAKEVGPTEATGSVLTFSQEDVSKKKKTGVEELRSFLAQEITNIMEELKKL